MKWKSLLTTVAVAAWLGCSGDSGPSQPGDTGDSGPTVAVLNNLFDPATLEIPLNSTVTWQWNSGGVVHNVTFQSAPSSGDRASGSFARRFDAAGSYSYVCTIHGAQVMSGVVNVAAGAGGTGGGGDGGGGGGYSP